jgi:hypothetical protein
MKSVRKISESQRWKYRRTPAPIEDAALASAPAPASSAPIPIEPHAERVMINRWVAARIVDWPSSSCFGCKGPIVYGAKWVELVCDDNRARFHSDCEPVWRAEQEALARKVLGIDSVAPGPTPCP